MTLSLKSRSVTVKVPLDVNAGSVSVSVVEVLSPDSTVMTDAMFPPVMVMVTFCVSVALWLSVTVIV